MINKIKIIILVIIIAFIGINNVKAEHIDVSNAMCEYEIPMTHVNENGVPTFFRIRYDTVVSGTGQLN